MEIKHSQLFYHFIPLHDLMTQIALYALHLNFKKKPFTRTTWTAELNQIPIFISQIYSQIDSNFFLSYFGIFHPTNFVTQGMYKKLFSVKFLIV